MDRRGRARAMLSVPASNAAAAPAAVAVNVNCMVVISGRPPMQTAPSAVVRAHQPAPSAGQARATNTASAQNSVPARTRSHHGTASDKS